LDNEGSEHYRMEVRKITYCSGYALFDAILKTLYSFSVSVLPRKFPSHVG
jgi:hypothetical protein